MAINQVPWNLREIPDPLLQAFLERILAIRPSADRRVLEEVFLELIRRHQGSVTVYIGWAVKDPYHLEDLVDITLAKAFENLSSYRSSNPFSSWLLRFAQQTVVNHFRAFGSEREPLRVESETVRSASAANPRGERQLREDYCKLRERCSEEHHRRLLEAWIRNQFDHHSWSEIRRSMSWDIEPESLRIACLRLVKGLQRVC